MANKLKFDEEEEEAKSSGDDDEKADILKNILNDQRSEASDEDNKDSDKTNISSVKIEDSGMGNSLRV